MWDYYQDKLLLAIHDQHEGDFGKVADFFVRNTGNIHYTKGAVQERHEYLVGLGPAQSQSPLEAILKKAKVNRKSQDFLKVTRDDLRDAFTTDFQGTKVKVSGPLIRFQRV